MSWKAAAASIIGKSHIEAGLPCQDSSAFKNISDDILVGALADGCGSAKLSHHGANIAVQSVIDFLSRIDWSSEDLNEKKARELSEKLVKHALNELELYSIENSCAIGDLACTLIAFVATPEVFYALQVGDGFIVTRSADSKYVLTFRPDHGEYFNETTFITSKDAIEHLQCHVDNTTIRFICASSDALEIHCIKFSDWTPYEPFFSVLEEYAITMPEPAQARDDLVEFLSRDNINQRTSDDKTLILSVQIT